MDLEVFNSWGKFDPNSLDFEVLVRIGANTSTSMHDHVASQNMDVINISDLTEAKLRSDHAYVQKGSL